MGEADFSSAGFSPISNTHTLRVSTDYFSSKRLHLYAQWLYQRSASRTAQSVKIPLALVSINRSKSWRVLQTKFLAIY